MTVDCVGYFNLSDLRREQYYKLKTILRKSVCRKSVYRSLRKSRGQLILVTPQGKSHALGSGQSGINMQTVPSCSLMCKFAKECS